MRTCDLLEAPSAPLWQKGRWREEGGDSIDKWYDDGHIYAMCTTHYGGRELTIHVFGLHDATKAEDTGKGYARRLLQRFRRKFGWIVASGVEDDSEAERFWRHMGGAGLIDEIRQYNKPDTVFRAKPAWMPQPTER